MEQDERLGAGPIQRPNFILGMPRSGSTFLHELLVQDTDNAQKHASRKIFGIAEKAGAMAANQVHQKKSAE